MPGNRAEKDGQAGAEASVATRDEGERRRRIDVRDVEPPREQGREGLARLLRDGERAVLTEQRDANRTGVEPLGVGADHVPLDPAVAAFEDLAEAVDEEVVADVVPAVSLDVVELDRTDDRGRLGDAVAVRTRRVVHEREAQGGRERWGAAPDLLVRVPGRSAGRSRARRPSGACVRARRSSDSRRRRRAASSPGREGGTRSGRTGRPTTGFQAATRQCVRARPFPCPADPRPRVPRPPTRSSDRRASACGIEPSQARASEARRG